MTTLNEGGPRAASVIPKAASHRLLLFGWFVYLTSVPFYVFKSGNPQPADFLMALLLLTLALGMVIRIPIHRSLYLSSTIFLTIVVLVNLGWWSVHQEAIFLMSPLFYIYNFGILVFVLSLFKAFGEETVLKITAAGILTALFLEFAIMVFMPQFKNIRGIGTFTNPNQLGYWSLLTGACWLAVRSRYRTSFLDVLVMAVLIYLAGLSLSKAAMISLFLLCIMAIGLKGMDGKSGLTVGVATLLLLPVLFMSPDIIQSRLDRFLEQDSAARVVTRLEQVGSDNDDNAAGRGYDRIWLYPQYLVTGAGEGAYRRFSEDYDNMEMHSSWGTLLFSYGVAGTLAFLAMLWSIFGRAAWQLRLYFIPVVLYGLTHQGLRFSLLWVFLGLVIAQATYGRRALETQRARSQGKPAVPGHITAPRSRVF